MRILVAVLLVALALNACQVDRKSVASDKPASNSPLKKAKISLPQLNEISGIVASKRNKDIFWIHNDSGDKARIFAINSAGELRLTVELQNTKATDWEDITLGKGPRAGLDYIYIADIGDNRARRDVKTIYRLIEPDLSALGDNPLVKIADYDAIRFRFPDGSRDAETLMSDPWNGDLYIVSKRENQVGVYVLPYPQKTDQILTANFLLKLPVTQITAGDISPDGRHIVLKNYEQIFYWKRSREQTLPQAMEKFPAFLNYVPEPQGEAICFSAQLDGYFTISEMADRNYTVLYFYPHRF
ncbi:hypothetical protein [Caldithrix abyssi]